MGHLFDLPEEAAGQGLQALDPLGDGSHPSGNDPLLTAQADKCLVKQIDFPDGLLGQIELTWSLQALHDLTAVHAYISSRHPAAAVVMVNPITRRVVGRRNCLEPVK